MKKLNFTPTLTEPCVYKNDEPLTFVAVYVDDGIDIAPTKDKCMQINGKLNNYFRTNRTTNGLFRGTEIHSRGKNVTLNQSLYIKTILKKYKMADANAHSSPLADENALYANEEADMVDLTLYRGKTGILIHAACHTRSDIGFVSHLLS